MKKTGRRVLSSSVTTIDGLRTDVTLSRQTCIIRAPWSRPGSSEEPCPPPLRPERFLSVPVVDVVVVVAVDRGSAVTPFSAPVVDIARDSEPVTAVVVDVVVVVATVVLVVQVVVAVAALRSMLEELEPLDELLLDVPV